MILIRDDCSLQIADLISHRNVIHKLDFINLGILNFSSIETPWDMEQIPWNHDIGFWYLHLIIRFYVSLLL